MYLSKRFIIIFLYFILINLFGIFLYFLEYVDLLFCSDCKEIDSSEVFDYIVVGAGSAGSIIARRLGEDKTLKILLLEVGKYDNTLLDIPSVGLLLQKSVFDWQYVTTPQLASCLALDNNASHWPMGKIVGGTSMLNNMVYTRGHFEDFNEWFQRKKNYNYDTDVLPYFRKLESNRHETKSSVYIKDLIFTSILPDILLDAATSLGFRVSQDTTDCNIGFGMPKVTIHKGSRWTTAHHLLSLNKPNIFLRTNRFVEEVLFHNNYEAYGVKYSYWGKSFYAKASNGVILSAGTIGSPKLLMLSGIGPKDHLDDLNIPCKVNLPVGENLLDHVTTGLDLILLNQSLGIGIEQMLSPYSIFEYFWYGTGPWTTGGCEVLGFMDTQSPISSHSCSKRPDLQFMVMPLGLNEDGGTLIRRLMGISDYTWNNYFALLNQTKTMTILPVLLHPKSRGTVRLKDKCFKSSPIINPKYLSNKDDVEILIRGINVIKKLTGTDAMKKLGARLNDNIFPGCENFKFDSHFYWECYVRHLTITSYHPVGTNKMGEETDSTTVVDFNFQVKGTNNLFVVDASVLPTNPSGNINGPILMLAEVASDAIKYRDFLNRERCSIEEIFIAKNYC
ncbi:hypothetical protein NQ318_019157 [Aromia moschata]|uniref:Glucose-methanol-choline oxidoreductase N-terminal domain-containing protein n=1 Tax=Aromia moschata TaxID=1265417 RepID=A0AAV8YSB0_9CUCU|nr:hypothetical protein NQ318_019157 [Aromia moschata]